MAKSSRVVTVAAALAFALACGASFGARGGGGHHGGHSHHGHGHSSVGFFFGGGWPYYPWYGWPDYYYPSYYYGYAPSYDSAYPTEWVERQDTASWWYYCASLNGFYPHVTQCPDGAWQRVSPQPAPGSDNLGRTSDAPAR
jgi:hypothetical protein